MTLRARIASSEYKREKTLGQWEIGAAHRPSTKMAMYTDTPRVCLLDGGMRDWLQRRRGAGREGEGTHDHDAKGGKREGRHNDRLGEGCGQYIDWSQALEGSGLGSPTQRYLRSSAAESRYVRRKDLGPTWAVHVVAGVVVRETLLSRRRSSMLSSETKE